MVSLNISKGEKAVLKVYFRAIEKGIIVSKPVIEGTRYDVILDDGQNLQRAQIKYADGITRSPGSVRVSLAKYTRNNRHNPLVYNDEIDVLLVYLPKVDKVCLLPKGVWKGKSSVYIRFCDSVNGQIYDCLRAEDYLW